MKKRFSDESNIHYTYTSANDLINNIDVVRDMINHHLSYQVPRLKELEEYYKGNNVKILDGKRRKEDHVADHRATHNFAKYVSQFIQGYMVGVPLKTQHTDEKVDEQLREINRINDADEHNSDLVLDQSIYGRAYELLHRNKDDETRFTILDVKETFVIYDTTVERNPIAGVRYVTDRFDQYNTFVDIFTHDQELRYQTNITSSGMTLIKEAYHGFGGVPIVEYENNKFRQGDFEDVLTLIDLYDAAQSDLANYSQDLNDAMLKIIGNLDMDIQEAKGMKEHNIIFLKTKPTADGKYNQADADYIYKQYDVQGMEAYKSRLFNDILLFTSIPNLLDEKFGGNKTGEALKMKLIGLKQKRATKERLFKKSLRDRYRLINNIMMLAAEGGFNVNDITITFTENLPSSIGQELEFFSKMGGELSHETLLSLLSFIENPQEEMERIKEENERRKERFSKDYDFMKSSIDKRKEESFKNYDFTEVKEDDE